jgi:hypothetical protein
LPSVSPHGAAAAAAHRVVPPRICKEPSRSRVSQSPPTRRQASITFKPTQSGQAGSTTALVTNGRYDAPDVPKGNILMLFNIQQPTGRQLREGVGNPYDELRSLVPEKYAQGMPLDVTDDNADQDFDL